MNRVFTVALIAALSLIAIPNLEAATGRDVRSKAMKDRDIQKARVESARAAKSGADARASHSPLQALDNMGALKKLSAVEKTDLGRISELPDIKKALEDIAKNDSPDTRELTDARLPAIALIGARGLKIELDQSSNVIDKLTNNEQSVLTFARFALRSYTKELSAENRKAVAFLLNRTVEILQSNPQKNIGEAFREANTQMAKEIKIALDLENVNKYCK